MHDFVATSEPHIGWIPYALLGLSIIALAVFAMNAKGDKASLKIGLPIITTALIIGNILVFQNFITQTYEGIFKVNTVNYNGHDGVKKPAHITIKDKNGATQAFDYDDKHKLKPGDTVKVKLYTNTYKESEPKPSINNNLKKYKIDSITKAQ